MSSGSKGSRSTKSSRGASERNNVGGGVHSQSKSDHNHNEKYKDGLPHKIAPTAEQLRIAQMIDNTHSEPEKVLQEKIHQVMQVTSVSTDDAIVALHDCDNDVNAAIDSLLEGEDQGEWRESTKKKKKSPATKGKDESESNKENRRSENREKGGTKPRGGGGGGSGPPRFRGRGGGRGNKEEAADGVVGRGSGSRSRGKMANGTAIPVSRGRGTRGRGSGNSTVNSRTFQKRKHSTTTTHNFTDSIDTWNPPTPEKVDNSANDLQIDNWDEETSGTTEDWDSEWTGSLDKTTVFGPSTTSGTKGQDNLAGITNAVVNHTPSLGSMGSVLGSSGSTEISPGGSRGTNSLGGLQQSLSEPASNVLSMGQPSQISSSSINSSQSYSTVPSGSYSTVPSGSLGQTQAIDLAALLQKAAPHSTLGRMSASPLVVDGPSLGSDNANLLSAISASVSGVQSVSSSGSQSYSPSISNSMFPNSVSVLGSSLSSGKVLGLSSQNSNLTSRSKSQSRRSFQSSSKIPSTAVEMPEVAMAALDMQFTGLEFGTETFDFTSDVKPVLGTGSSVNARDSSVASVTKDLSSLNSNLSQQPALGPQPIPFPTQASKRNPSNASLLAGTQRAPSSSSSGVSQLAELAKKDSSAGGGPLGSLVGSGSSGHSSYQSSGSAYSSKPPSSFPNPPSAHYAQTPSQSYGNSSSTGVSSGSYGGSGNAGPTGSAGGGQSSGGYGASYSAAGGQYPNNYVNPSSHSLASISVPKSQGLSALKDSSQSYSDGSAASHLSGSLSGSAASGDSSGLSAGGPNSVQSTKSSVPGKSINSLGGSSQQHSVSQTQQHQVQQQLNQHHQPHHHLQQQQQAQLLAGPSPSQYVSPQAAALQGTLPQFYNVQQPAMYSYEDLQMFQRIPHMQQAPTTISGGRDGTITSPGSYSMGEGAKFRPDQNTSPVPSTINQQGAAAAGTYITATQSAPIHPYYMYQAMPPVPSSFTQYATPPIPVIQTVIPPSTHTGSTTSQFPGAPPKLPYGGGSSTYYDSISQGQDYKTGYGAGSQGQNKTGPSSTGSVSNSGSDLTGYKNPLGKVNRYDKQAFHTGNQAFNLAGSGGYAPMFIPTMPTAQHHSTMMQHPLHQVRANQMDGGNSASQRTTSGGNQNKGVSKGVYGNSYWGGN